MDSEATNYTAAQEALDNIQGALYQMGCIPSEAVEVCLKEAVLAIELAGNAVNVEDVEDAALAAALAADGAELMAAHMALQEAHERVLGALECANERIEAQRR